jgi:hypothetical protein
MAGTTGLEPATSAVTAPRSYLTPGVNAMTTKHRSEPFWINEPGWLCAVEFLNDEDTEGRDIAADTIGYLWGYARLTNTRSLALLGDPSAEAYEILFSFSTPEEKARFLAMVRSNDDLGDHYINTDLIRPTMDEIRARHGRSLQCCHRKCLVRATLIAAAVCTGSSGDNLH